MAAARGCVGGRPRDDDVYGLSPESPDLRPCYRVKMGEVKTDPLGPRRTHIDPNEPYELTYWTKKLGITSLQLLEAIRIVGTSAEAVERHFEGS